MTVQLPERGMFSMYISGVVLGENGRSQRPQRTVDKEEGRERTDGLTKDPTILPESARCLSVLCFWQGVSGMKW